MKRLIRIVSVLSLVIGCMDAVFSQEDSIPSGYLSLKGGYQVSMIGILQDECTSFFMMGSNQPVPYEDVFVEAKEYTVTLGTKGIASFLGDVVKRELYYDPDTGFDLYPNWVGIASVGFTSGEESIIDEIVYFPYQSKPLVLKDTKEDRQVLPSGSQKEYKGLVLEGLFYVLVGVDDLEDKCKEYNVPYVITSNGELLVPVRDYKQTFTRGLLEIFNNKDNLDKKD